MVVSVSNLKNGMAIKLNNELFTIIYFQHVKPGKGGAFVRTKIKNVLTGAVLEKTYRSEESLEDVYLESKDMEYLYQEGDHLIFMDPTSYDQITIDYSLCEEAMPFIKENDQVRMMFYQGKAIRADVPLKVKLKVTETPPNFKGNTASGGTKPATLETGLIVQVPFFIENGDILEINTEKREYIQRANS